MLILCLLELPILLPQAVLGTKTLNSFRLGEKAAPLVGTLFGLRVELAVPGVEWVVERS